MIEIDNIILGDNQFFGVNHMSQDKGRISYEKFKDLNEIKKTIYYAMDNGVKGVFFSTHPAIYQIADMLRTDTYLKNNLSIYVNIPYIIKYVQMLNEMGMVRTIKTMFSGNTALKNIQYIFKTGWNVLINDYLGIANRLIDIELNPFHDLNIKAIFLHNGLVDLALGYNMTVVIKSFYNYIQKRYKVIPAFGTLNYSEFCNMLKKAGINNALVMTSVNKKGFLMNPGRESCEKTILENSNIVLAMGTLASGSIKPDEAYEYLASLKTIQHVVVGLSSKEHAEETFRAIRKHLNIL